MSNSNPFANAKPSAGETAFDKICSAFVILIRLADKILSSNEPKGYVSVSETKLPSGACMALNIKILTDQPPRSFTFGRTVFGRIVWCRGKDITRMDSHPFWETMLAISTVILHLNYELGASDEQIIKSQSFIDDAQAHLDSKNESAEPASTPEIA
ncbi:hypothetical protein HYS03_01320 [Candidatus Woesebacteria bacterium]|nr:hypothetical protein [Candidatus Woesebacteria bacterium]QQG47299.1 MAG: hypothetical protein HY044_04200 [Candidatus Woesebacteria bacterium]